MKVRLALCVLCVITFSCAQVPDRPPNWKMNASTIIMPCNYSGYTDPETTKGWSVLDFDWSNAKSIWAQSKPMNDEELLFEQVKMTTAATANSTVWVYRCSVYAYSWYTSVRQILDDPAYSPWFIKFKDTGPWFSPKCDNNYDPPKCSNYFHMQEQTPGYPTGDGNCTAPGCDCGVVPCGFYLWNHSSTVVVKGQTFQQWFIDSYMFNEVGLSPLVSGFFWDDTWNVAGKLPDSMPNVTEDTGLTHADLESLTDSYNANMAVLQQVTLAKGKFSWQMLWTGGDPTGKGSTCPGPIVQQSTCESDLRSLCNSTSPAQTRTMMYSFYPGRCNHTFDPSVLEQLPQDLANFLLIRGPYAYLGHGWLGCSKFYDFPDELNLDYGEPTGLCYETDTGSGVFEREFSKSIVSMDCGTWTPKISFK